MGTFCVHWKQLFTLVQLGITTHHDTNIQCVGGGGVYVCVCVCVFTNVYL